MKMDDKVNLPDNFTVRESVKPTRLYLDNEYFKKGYAAVFPHSVTVVYSILAMFANHKTQTCYPAANTIMKIGGITNRNTVFEALKILERYGIIGVVHRSKGRVPNLYAMLEHYGWEDVDSIDFDTVREEMRKRKTVSNTNPQQSQSDSNNSSPSDTGIHIKNSNNLEVIPKISFKGMQSFGRVSQVPASVVILHPREEDIESENSL